MVSNIFCPSYKILLIQYPEEPFSLQSTLYFVGNKCLFFCNIYCGRFIGKDLFKIKISKNVLNFENSVLGLKFEYN